MSDHGILVSYVVLYNKRLLTAYSGNSKCIVPLTWTMSLSLCLAINLIPVYNMEFYCLYTYINKLYVGPGWLNEVVGLPNNSYKPITNTTWVGAICKLQKGCTRLAAASDKVYQLLAHGRWFSPASSTTKTGRQDIAESGVKTPKTNQNQ